MSHRAFLWSVLAACLLVGASGCVTPLAGSGGPALVEWRGVEEGRDDTEARRAELERARAQLWGVASGVREVGAKLLLTYWVENGALTLVGYRAESRDGLEGGPVDQSALGRVLEPVFGTFTQQHLGQVQLVLRREHQGWALEGYTAGAAHVRPPEARRLPVRTEGVPSRTFLSVQEAASRLVQLLPVPHREGRARLVAEVRLEDGRVLGTEARLYEATRSGGSGLGAGSFAAVELASVLLPFTEGLGQRTVRLEVVAVHPLDEGARVWVAAAEVERAPLPYGMDEDFAAEYHAMHESILRRWREEVAEGTAWVLQRGAEEMALWYVGGIFAHGMGVLAKVSAPVMKAVLERGGRAAAGWLRSALVRLAPQERRAFEQLWMKVQLEGEAALGVAERKELRGLMLRLEQRLGIPLDGPQKDRLREAARKAYSDLHPHLQHFLDTQPHRHPIHHRRPLEYCHLFPDEDINAPRNLAMVRDIVHRRINALWNKVRAARPQATAEEINAAARRIDAHFSPWYHRADEPPGVSLVQAEASALDALRRLFPELR